MTKRPLSSLDESLLRQEILSKVIQKTEFPPEKREHLLTETCQLFQDFLLARGATSGGAAASVSSETNNQTTTVLVDLVVDTTTTVFTNPTTPSTAAASDKDTRTLMQAAARDLLQHPPLPGRWAVSLVLAYLALGEESLLKGRRAAASAITSVVETTDVTDQQQNALLACMVSSMMESLLTLGVLEELQPRQPQGTATLLDVQIVGMWAKCMGITVHENESLAKVTAQIVQKLMSPTTNNNEDGDDVSLNSQCSAEERAAAKVRWAGVLTLATQLAPWEILEPSILIKEAVPHALWAGAERVCDSVVQWHETHDQPTLSTKSTTITTVQTLIDIAMESRNYRRADSFATKFFAHGGKERYLEARYYHACSTISKVIQKRAFPVVERQVERIDAAVKEVPPPSGEDTDRSSDIRLFTLSQLGEAGRIEEAKRLSELWSIDHTFDEEALKQAAEARRQKYLQWEEALPELEVPELISSPEQLLGSFLNVDDDQNDVEHVYGFDAEWGDGNSWSVALLQIATTKKVALVDIPALSKTVEGAEALQRTVGKLFESPNVTVIGFSCSQDMGRLLSTPCALTEHWLGDAHGVVDIQKVLKQMEPTLRNLGLSRVCEQYLGKPLDKSEQCSSWSTRPLSKEQRTYAALDAWACAALYQKVGATKELSTPSPEKKPKQPTGRPGFFLGLLFLIFSMATIPTSYAFSGYVPFHARPARFYSSALFESAPSSSTPSGGTRADPSQTTPQEPTAPAKRTLYDVLHAHPDMTRAQLKHQYVKLAKQSHPDALLQKGDNANSDLDFTEIAAAWEILSDAKQRKRYDRSLQAEEFSRQVEEWAGQAFNQAVPVAQAFGRVAVPFLRKTAAGTVAGVTAAASAYSKAAEAEEVRATSQSDPVEFSDDSEVVMLTPETEEITSQSKRQPTESKGFANAGSSNAAMSETAQENAPDEPLASSRSTSKKPQRTGTKVSGSPLFGQNVDRRSLVDKSKSLEERASRFLQEAAAAKEEIDPILEKRLHLALHTPHSGLTASEAGILLEDLNKTVADRLSPLDRAMLRHTVLEEIDSLKRTESQFVTAQKADTQAQDIYRDAVQQRVQNAEALSQAVEDEDEARRRWVAAQDLVKELRQNRADTTRALAEAEIEAKKSDYQLELQQMQLEKQAEKVRKALKQKESQARRAKEQEIRAQQKQQSTDGSVMIQDDPSATLLDETWYYPDDDSPERLAELRDLRAEEQRLRQTSSRLDDLAARLLSRANKLQQKVQDLDR